jgi:HlyD family secretion protein
VALLIAVSVLVVLWLRGDEGPVAYDTALVRRGDLAVTVTASGTLAPVDTVSVGTEVSGSR